MIKKRRFFKSFQNYPYYIYSILTSNYLNFEKFILIFYLYDVSQFQVIIDTWVKYQLDGTDGANKEKLIKAVLQPRKQLNNKSKET